MGFGVWCLVVSLCYEENDGSKSHLLPVACEEIWPFVLCGEKERARVFKNRQI